MEPITHNDLLSSEFYAKKIKVILTDTVTYKEYVVPLRENFTTMSKREDILNNFFIPFVIKKTLLDKIKKFKIDDIGTIEKNYIKLKKIFPTEFILDKINKLNYSFYNYLTNYNKTLIDIDEDDLMKYSLKLKEDEGFKYLINNLSEATSNLLKDDIKILKLLDDILPKKHIFKPRAKLLLQLGNQLIKDEGLALFELVKNSYDADATFCNVKLDDIDKKLGTISILDNGSGMNFNLITEHWLEPGTDIKEDLVNSFTTSHIYGRLPLGEKGIGRFGSHKLGQRITIYTKTDFDEEVEININWNDFKDVKYLEDVPIDVKTNKQTPIFFKKSINKVSLETFSNLIAEIKKENRTSVEKISFLKSLYKVENSMYKIKPKILNDIKTYKKLKLILNSYNYNTSGTYIKITNLWEKWSKGMLRNTFRAVNAINSPFENHQASNFKVDISTNKKDWLDELLTTQKAIEKSLFQVNGCIEDNKIHLNYKFTPLKGMKLLNKREESKDIHLKEKVKIFDHIKQKYINKEDEYSLKEKYNIGKINFQFYIYDLGSEVSQFIKNDISGLRLFLKQNGGIRIYRDKIRVYDYGEPGNDWLKLDFQRVSNPTQKISNNQLLGAIYLDRNTSKNLIEKTNREGFIINEAYEKFAQSISQLVSEIAVERGKDKGLIKQHYGPKNSQEPVISSLNKLNNYVDNNIKEENIKNSIKKQLLEVEEEYTTMTENLLAAAGSGLTMNIAIHEIEKIVYELIKRAEDNEFHKDVKLLIDNLHTTILTYSNLTKINIDETCSLKDAIKKLQDVNFYRLALHNITLIDNTINLKKDIEVKFTEKLLIASLSNIVDNSIYWLDEKEKENNSFEKKIFIDITYDISEYPTIVISDNGKGFGSMSKELAKKAYSTNKKISMGLGLYIIDETMKLHGSRLLFPEVGDISSVPKDINNAIVALEIGGDK